MATSCPTKLSTHPDQQDESSFELKLGVGQPGMLRWADRWTATIDVLPTDTLGHLANVLNENEISSPFFGNVRVAPSADTTLLWSHSKLPHPRPDATLAENGLKQGNILRWVVVKKD